MKWVLWRGSYCGCGLSFSDLSIHAIFSPSERMVWSPSLSFRTSSGVKPCTEFQYCDDTTGILQIVKYWLSCSKVAEAPTRRHDTTETQSFPAISPSLQKNRR